MKKKDLINIKSRSSKDIIKLVFEKKSELKKKNLEIKSGKEKNLKVSKNLRRDISQLLTLIKQAQIIEQNTEKVEKNTEKKEVKK